MWRRNKRPPEPERALAEQSADAEQTAPPKGMKERLYDKIPLTVRQLDIIIAVLVVAFIVVFIVGALKGNGILK